MTKIYIGLAAVWIFVAVVRWCDDDADAGTRRLSTALAVGWTDLAAGYRWRHLRRAPS